MEGSRAARSVTFAVTASHFLACRRGATAIEYGLMAGLVALVAVPGLIWLREWQTEVSQKLDAGLNFGTSMEMIEARSDFREPPRDSRDHQ